ELRREQRPLKDLWVSTKCGESDTTSGCGANPTVGNAFDKLYPHGVTLVFGETTELTGGEQLVAARCRNDAVRKKFQFVFDRYQEVIDRHKTGDLMDSQPTKGNIAGGLTTIEEKALGNIQKIGRKCPVDGVLDQPKTATGERPPDRRRGSRPPRVRSHAVIRIGLSTLAVEVWRGGAQGAFQSFEVPRHPSQTVLDVVTYIQRSLDATLAYRFACRVGMCGS